MKYEIGNPPTLLLDLIEKVYKCEFVIPSSEATITELLIEHVREYTNPIVCLSGGYDSQFMCLLLKQAGIDFTAVTYESMWGLNVINSADTTMAIKFAEKHNIELDIITLDFKNFLETELHVKYAKQYSTTSPQIAFHLYFLDQIDYINRSIVMGGDIPNILIDEDKDTFTYETMSSGFFVNSIIPYKEYSIQNNVKMLKNLLFGSPDILYKAFKNVLDVANKHKIICSPNPEYCRNHFKECYYNNLLDTPLTTNFSSNTGFHSIRVYMSTLSGNYDHFDNNYRLPLIRLQNSNPNFQNQHNLRLIVKNVELILELGEEIKQLYIDGKLEIPKHYKLNL
jgi:hypothetical protein|tara:strand:+ start:2980 stop:3996 length:1017 start_codon:yes stop_codon:yes gene_type:complete